MSSVASYIIVRKSTESFSFISEWLTYAQDSRALTDDPNVLGKDNYDGFIDHRHDQSILSLLAKKWKLIRYTDPSQWGENFFTSISNYILASSFQRLNTFQIELKIYSC